MGWKSNLARGVVVTLALELLVSSVEVVMSNKAVDNCLSAASAYAAEDKPRGEAYEARAKNWLKRRNQVEQFSRYLPYHFINSKIRGN